MDLSLVRVLLVEDSEDDYVVTREFLADAQSPRFELEWVSTYETALAAIARQQHDVYLIDYRLGAYSGLDVLQAALEGGCDAPFILITGSAVGRQIDLEAMQLGAIDYLPKKEITTELLERTLRYAIRHHRLYQQVQQLNTSLEQQVAVKTAELQLALDFEATLKRITDNVRDSLDESHILQTAVAELAALTDVLSCNAALYDLQAGISTTCYESTTYDVPRQGRVTQLAYYPEIYDQLSRGLAFQFCSLDPHPVRGQTTMLTCPIVDDQGILGDLWLIKLSSHVLSEQDIRLVRQVASQCAIALRQSRLYHAAQAQVEELERLDRLKDDFLDTVTHELRTPMANIKMAIQMLEIVLQQTGVLNEEVNRAARYFDILRTECQREIDLINDLLDISRLDAGVEPLMLTTIQLQDWVPHVIEPFAERTRNQQHVQLNLRSPLLPLTTDATYLERILTELLHNACKYTPAEEQIVITAQSTDSMLQISISNSGSEIPPAELPRIFDKFHRIPSHDPWKHGGTGLGLALVKRRVKRLQGTIAVESDRGWTTFTLLLPWNLKQD